MTDSARGTFALAMPPGWLRFPAAEKDRDALHAMVELVIERSLPASLPRDRYEPLRQEVRKRLIGSILDAERSGARAVYLPVVPINGVVVPASIIEYEIDQARTEDADTVIDAFLHDGFESGEAVDVDGAPGVRVELQPAGPDPSGDFNDVTSRQVVYAVEADKEAGRWILLSFSVVALPSSDPRFQEALVMFFDAVMTTFRWIGADGVNHSDLEERLAAIDSLELMRSAS